MSSILCSISTKGRYDTTLPLAIASVINQTKTPDKLIIFDDNDSPKDLRELAHYSYLFNMLDIKQIAWEVIFGAKKGQSHNHQLANTMNYDWIWRLDDDNIAEPNVLETLCSYIRDDVGAIGGSILTPPLTFEDFESSGKIEHIYNEPNLQWKKNITQVHEVEHLHCSYLYRAGIQNFNLGLSTLCHREETLHTFGICKRGYKNLVVPNCITWHLKNPSGGIRSNKHTEQDYNHDEEIFKNIISFGYRPIVVLNNGMGDHLVFKRVLADLNDPVVFSCYPDIIPGKSIAESQFLFGDIEEYNVYRKMAEWKWTDSLENAFRKLYL